MVKGGLAFSYFIKKVGGRRIWGKIFGTDVGYDYKVARITDRLAAESGWNKGEPRSCGMVIRTLKHTLMTEAAAFYGGWRMVGDVLFVKFHSIAMGHITVALRPFVVNSDSGPLLSGV